jgi:hypothetical protein
MTSGRTCRKLSSMAVILDERALLVHCRGHAKVFDERDDFEIKTIALETSNKPAILIGSV